MVAWVFSGPRFEHHHQHFGSRCVPFISFLPPGANPNMLRCNPRVHRRPAAGGRLPGHPHQCRWVCLQDLAARVSGTGQARCPWLVVLLVLLLISGVRFVERPLRLLELTCPRCCAPSVSLSQSSYGLWLPVGPFQEGVLVQMDWRFEHPACISP